MSELWTILLPILAADVLNPILFGFLVYAAGTPRGVVNSAAALLGHTLAYFVAGVVLALGLDRLSDALANPSTIDFVAELVIGAFIVGVAVRSGKGGSRANEPTSELTPLRAFGMGAVINIIGLPFAVPYIGAVSQIVKVQLDPGAALISLAAYNLLYAAPFLPVPLLVLILGPRSRAPLERVNSALTRIADRLLPPLIGLVGLVLMADALAYFAVGRPLFAP